MAWWEEIGLGIRVIKAAAAISVDASPGERFFTVAGGLVRLTGLLGYCTVAPGASNNCNFTLDPAEVLGAVTPLCTNLDITASTEGDIITITGDPGVAMVGGHLGMQLMMDAAPAGVVLTPGYIGFIADDALGTFLWVIWYKPIDSGATVTVT